MESTEIEIDRIAQAILCATAPFKAVSAGDIWESREGTEYSAGETVGDFVRAILCATTVLGPNGARDYAIQISKSDGTVAEAGAEIAANIREFDDIDHTAALEAVLLSKGIVG